MKKKLLAERAQALASTRTFFASRGYLEVETPVAVPSPGLDVHLDAFALSPGDRFLATSPEYQMKRLVAEHPRIFQLTRAFRAGERGERHNPEFTILEFYRHGDVEGVMRDTEQLVARLTGGRVVVDGRTIELTPPFPRLTVREAFARHAGIAPAETLRLAREDEDTFFEKLAFTIEPALAALDHGTFLVDWPTPMASLARRKADDPDVAERFELYVAGIELCNGFGELTDPAEQRARLLADQEERRRRNKPVYPLDERFLEALEHGLPPCAGNAVGFDRLVALAHGSREIAPVLAFPDDEL